MNVNDFYERYGRYIYRAQTLSSFPYLRPVTSLSNSFSMAVNQNGRYFSKFKCCGYNYTPTPISSVFNQTGSITYYPINQGNAAISYEFSGCYMAKFQLQNQWFICHIQSGQASCTRDFYDFFSDPANTVRNLILFKPTNNNDLIGIITNKQRTIYKPLIQQAERRIQVCGLITPDNRCFSMCMDTVTCIPIYIEQMSTLHPTILA